MCIRDSSKRERSDNLHLHCYEQGQHRCHTGRRYCSAWCIQPDTEKYRSNLQWHRSQQYRLHLQWGYRRVWNYSRRYRSTCGNICNKHRRYGFNYSRYGSNYGYGQYLSKARINTHRPLYDNQKAIDMRRYGKCRAACSLSKHKNKELRLLHRSPLLWGNIYENRR